MQKITPNFAGQWEGDVGNSTPDSSESMATPTNDVSEYSAPNNNALVNSASADSAPAQNDPSSDAIIAELNRRYPSQVSNPPEAKTQRAQTGTMFHQAGTPPPAGTPEMGIGETVGKAALNFLPSVGGALKATGTALIHPIDTLGSLKDLGVGAYSKAQGDLGYKQDDAQKAKDEALLNGLVSHYKQVYGSTAGFKKAFAEDPASILLDASTFLGGAGAVGKLGGMGKVAELASEAASVIDPVSGALKMAGKVAKMPVNIVRGAAAMASGTPIYLQEMQTAAGAAPKAMREAYLRFATGQGDPTEYLQTAQKAIKADKALAVQEYLKQKGGLLPGNPSFDDIDAALKSARSETQMTGANSPQFKPANDELDKAERIIEAYKYSPHADTKTIIGFDNLKQAIRDLQDQTGNSVANRHLSSLYNSVKDSIRKIDPAYDDLMEKYSTSMNGVNDAQRSLIGGDRAAATAALAKSLRSVKDTTGVNMIERMAKHEPTLPYMLAGHAANPSSAGVMRGIQDMVAGSLLGYNVHPLAGVATMLAGSPNLVGKANYAAGRLGSLSGIAPVYRGAKAIASKIPSKGVYYAGRVNQENNQELPEVSSEDDDYVNKVIGHESSGDENAKNPYAGETASGLGQFTDSTWLDQMNKNFPDLTQGKSKEEILAMKTDPELQRKAILAFAKDNAAELERRNIPVNNVTKFGAHWFGPSGFPKLYDAYNANPDAPIESVFPKETTNSKGETVPSDIIAHNRLEGKTVGQVMQMIETTMSPKKEMLRIPITKGNEAYPNAAGGRIGRASGGRIDHAKHDMLVNRLMTMAKRAKKGADAATEPLLNAPDESIVKALNVAQQAI